MYLVTGGAGFIGSHLVARLVAQRAAVRILDNFSSGTMANLVGLADQIDLIDGDIRDPETVQRALANVDIIFHLAAQPSVPLSIADPRTTIDINVTGTLNLLESARDVGCQRLVFASTCAIYGDAAELPKREVMPPAPLSPYAASKLMGEYLCAIFTRTHGLETVSLRYFNVFGPRQDPASAYAAAIPRFIAALQTGVSPVIYGDGEQTRDFVAVDDVVAANLQAATVTGIEGQVFNVAGGHPVSINRVLAELARLLGTDVPVQYERERPGDIRHSYADLQRTKTVLSFAPKLSFAEGLAQLVADPRLPTQSDTVGVHPPRHPIQAGPRPKEPTPHTARHLSLNASGLVDGRPPGDATKTLAVE